MLDNILAALALATLVGFLAILFFTVPRVDLGIVLGATVALAFIDFFVKREKKN